MEKKRKKRKKRYERMTKRDRERPFDLQFLRRKRTKTKEDIRRLKKFDEVKAKLPPFDNKCKACGKPIPKPLPVCSSKCKEKLNAKKKPKQIKRKQRVLA